MPSKRGGITAEQRAEMAEQTANEKRQELEASGEFVDPLREEPPPMTDFDLRAEAERIFEQDLVDSAEIDSDIASLDPENWPPPKETFNLDKELPGLFPQRQGPGLHAKITEVIQEVQYIQKTGTAPPAMGGYKFVEAGNIAATLRMALAKRQITMLPESVSQVGEVIAHTTKSGGTLFLQTVHQRWRLTDAESGETAIIESMGTGGDNGDKYSPKAQTNAMKYALQVGFMLETGDDPEKFDLSDAPTGNPVTITPSSVTGVKQGGRQSKATEAQLDAIRRQASLVQLTPEALCVLIGAALGGRMPELADEGDVSDHQRTILAFLSELSFDDCGKVVKAVLDVPPANSTGTT